MGATLAPPSIARVNRRWWGNGRGKEGGRGQKRKDRGGGREIVIAANRSGAGHD